MSEAEQIISKRKRKAQESWASKKSEKKTKILEEIDEEAPINPAVGEPKKKKKTKAVDQDEKAAAGQEVTPQKSKRFILFVGNLSFKTTVDELQAHIKPTGVTPLSVRLQTDQKTNTPKGFAFIDLPNAQALDKVLNLHHTSLAGRRINVELTAGGGGSGEARKAKIAKKNERLDVERETAQKTKRDAEAKKTKVRGPRPDSQAAKEMKEKRELEMNDINPARRKRIG